MANSIYASNYTPVGDLIVVSICYVLLILMIFSYITKTRAFRIFFATVGLIFLAALTDVGYHRAAATGNPDYIAQVYAMRCLYHGCLFAIFQMFTVYIGEVTQLPHKRKVLFDGLGGLVFLSVVGLDIADTVRSYSASMTDMSLVFEDHGVFICGYLVYVALIIAQLAYVRKRLFRRVMLGFYGTMAISFLFLVMKAKISELRQKGIKFYLDDFGTGYSNMERIMELPFDIIKFDRSMVLACGTNERSKKIVVKLAGMLSEMNYAVLFEGVESLSDEQMCAGMSASYLQGYKYSKPVPIERLRNYFEQKSLAPFRMAEV